MLLASLIFIGCAGTHTSLRVGGSLPVAGMPADTEGDSITICSFNIKFLGHYKSKDHRHLAAILDECDIAVIQELVAPPYGDFDYPDGSPVAADNEASQFFDEMLNHQSDYILSEEDTGPNEIIHSNGTGTEWWVAFFRPDRIEYADDLPNGFLADDRSHNDEYDRVPYAFGFRTPGGNLDFVLISVHLRAEASEREWRKNELEGIAAWIAENNESEKDFIILGDMNIQNAAELAKITPGGFVSLNDECRPTNTNPRSPKPYDHVMFNERFTSEMDRDFGLEIIDLVEAMRPLWSGSNPYPGDPYDGGKFGEFFSDHSPVVFQLRVPAHDDDP